jgi:hypothetical protein
VASADQAPVAAYSFDAGEGEVAEDLFGEHDGAIEGAEWFDKGRFGSALSFDGEKGEEVTIADANDLDFTEEFTLEAWVRPRETVEWSQVITKQRGAGISYQLTAHGNHNAPVGYIQGAEKEWGVDGGTTPLPENVWSHIAYTSDGGKLRFYVNGELKGTESGFEALAGTGPLVIGGGLEGEVFEGLIDEVRVYNRALSEGEVVADSGAGLQTPSRTPVAAYSFDAAEGEVAEDVTGNEHDGAIEGGAEWFDNGRFGSALDFDGEEESCVTIADAEDLRITEELTVEAWVRPHSVSDQPIIYKDSYGHKGHQLAIGLYETGKPEAFLAEGYEGEYDSVEGSESLEANVWTHLAFTYDGGKMRLYVNGELAASKAHSEGAPWGEGDLVIGCNPNYPPERFEGLIDEVRVYNRALSDAELRQTMNAGFPKAITEAATETEANDAILNGTADANGGETEYFFEYGPTKSYGSVVMGEELGSKQEAIEINEAVIDLAPETTYHYRLVADSPAGVAHGKDQTFTTLERTMTGGEEEEFMNAEDNMDLIASESKAGPGNFYGMMWTGNLQKMKNQSIWEAIERSGAKVVRFAIYPYPHLQKEIDEAFEEAAKRDITVLPYFGSGPFPRAGADREDWIKYAKKMVNKYGPDSSFSPPVKAWEIWNEPNMPFQGASDNQEGKVNPEGFAVFFKEMSEALRTASEGGIQVLTPGLYGYRVPGCHPECHLTPREFLKRMDQKLSELSYSNAYNAVSLHPYVFKIGEPKHQHEPRDQGEVKRVAKAIKRVITAVHALKPGKPLWITELGFPVANPENRGNVPPVTTSVQDQLVQASFSMMQNNRQRLDISHAFYYNIQDDSKPGWEYHSGLLTLKGKARSAWTPYSNLADGKSCPHAPC